jgi:hypothetical protein
MIACRFCLLGALQFAEIIRDLCVCQFKNSEIVIIHCMWSHWLVTYAYRPLDSGVLSPFFCYLPLGKRWLPGLQTFRVFTFRSLLFRDFDVIEADEPAQSMFWHPNSRCFAPKEKKRS